MTSNRRFPRRTFLGVAAAGALAACAPNTSGAAPATTAGADASGSAVPSSTGETLASDAPVSAAPAGSTAATESTAAATLPPTVAPPAAGGPAAFVPNGPRDRRQVALTFHCAGESALATRLLDVFKERGVAVTVFAVGTWLDQNPGLAQRMLADGHELANHTWSHGAMRTMGAATMADEITRCANAIERYNGSIGRWFRPSQIEVPTDAILAAAGKAGYATSVGYDVDSLDFQDPSAAAVRANVAKGVQGGSIVSLHFGHANTPAAMPNVLDDLAKAGLQPVTVSTLLS